ncbi:Abi family protein [Achromobacter spanius]|uniref:Abi family protein n=1 Tax=Achromobacter spanius TaxID=217203 RepID=UPI003825446F
MTINDKDAALHYMRHVGGYRLKGYWFHLREPGSGSLPRGTSFDHVIQRYEFDRALRRIFFEALEQIEISVRAQMSNYFSGCHGPHWFLLDGLFHSREDPASPGQSLPNEVRQKIERDVNQARDRPYVQHYRKNYSSPPIPPSWTTSECLSFGVWSRAHRALKDPTHKSAIAKIFNVHHASTFSSWLHVLSVLRNGVAHHGRLWRLDADVKPLDYKQKKIHFDEARRRSLYAASTVINYVLDNVSLANTWRDTLQSVLAEFPTIGLGDIGFPDDWDARPGWDRADNTTPPAERSDAKFAPSAGNRRSQRRAKASEPRLAGAMAQAFKAAESGETS